MGYETLGARAVDQSPTSLRHAEELGYRSLFVREPAPFVTRWRKPHRRGRAINHLGRAEMLPVRGALAVAALDAMGSTFHNFRSIFPVISIDARQTFVYSSPR
jgi:hypothetical protein